MNLVPFINNKSRAMTFFFLKNHIKSLKYNIAYKKYKPLRLNGDIKRNIHSKWILCNCYFQMFYLKLAVPQIVCSVWNKNTITGRLTFHFGNLLVLLHFISLFEINNVYIYNNNKNLMFIKKKWICDEK